MNIRFAPSSLKKGKRHHKFHEQNMHPFGTRLIQFPFITAQVLLSKREGIQFGREGSCGKFEFYLKQEGRGRMKSRKNHGNSIEEGKQKVDATSDSFIHELF